MVEGHHNMRNCIKGSQHLEGGEPLLWNALTLSLLCKTSTFIRLFFVTAPLPPWSLLLLRAGEQAGPKSSPL